jgi:CheY-like chemotaxis protein
LPVDVMDVPAEALPSALETDQRWLPRTRVLLVEDMPANQMIVATLLRREGHLVDVAGSGLEALEMIAARAYDLALLDIFMPGIDGLETAWRVRALPGPAGRVKLVALTANVSPEDRAEYHAAGMDDLVPKPVERTALLAALSRHVWPGRRTTVPAPPAVMAAGRAPSGPVLDARRVESWQEGLPATVSDRLFQDCLRQLRDMLPALETALTLRDQPSVKRVTHAFGGVAGNYGLAALETLMRTIAANAQEPSFDPHREVKDVEDAIEQAEQAVRALMHVAAA